MNKIDLSNVSTTKRGDYNWKKSINLKIYFEYENIQDYFTIIDYNRPNLTIQYLNFKSNINTGDFKNVRLKKFFKKFNNGSSNRFKISKDGKFWIGYTKNNDKFLFNGNEKVVNYIKSNSWSKTSQGYFINGKNEKLHRVVMEVKDPNIFVNHIGGKLFDNRIENLSISDCSDNTKEKCRFKNNKTGIIGLQNKYGDKYIGVVTIDGITLYSKHKIKEEALIDLLIMQKHYGIRHNLNLFYLIKDIDENRVKEVIDNCERQINNNKNKICTNKITPKNIYRKSEEFNCYIFTIKTREGREYEFKISNESLEKAKQINWNVYITQHLKEEKVYIKGRTKDENGKSKTVALHRFLLGIDDKKYKNFIVDHKNGDSLDNRLDNLCITNYMGNGTKSKSKWISKHIKDTTISWRVECTIFGKKYYKLFKTKEEAKEYVEYLKTIIENKKPTWNSKEELDKYLQENIDK